MDGNDKVGTYQFVAEPFHVDFAGRLTMGGARKPPAELRGLSCRRARLRDCGAERKPLHVGAVAPGRRAGGYAPGLPEVQRADVDRKCIQALYRPQFCHPRRKGEAARVCPLRVGDDQHGNSQARRPAHPARGAITGYVCDKECPIDRPGRIKVGGGSPEAEYQTKYSDIDINGHVNSIKYIEHILDLFPLDMFREKTVRRFEMAYVAEKLLRRQAHVLPRAERRERIRYGSKEERLGSGRSEQSDIQLTKVLITAAYAA